MEIYLVRHAIAEEGTSQLDDRRALTREGVKKMRLTALGLARIIESPQELKLFASPLKRSVQTAEILKEELSIKGAIERIAILRPEVRPTEHLAFWRNKGLQRVMLVGHEPQLSGLIGALLGLSPSAVEVKKASATFIEIENLQKGFGLLRWHIPPSVSRETAKSE